MGTGQPTYPVNLADTDKIVSTSAGVADAGKLIKTNANGLVDPTFLFEELEFKNGTTTKDAADASGTQNIAHGLGKIPKKVRIQAMTSVGETITLIANTVYNGTTQSSVSMYRNNSTGVVNNTFTLNAASATATCTGVVTFDATNIIITWTKTGSSTGTYYLLWKQKVNLLTQSLKF